MTKESLIANNVFTICITVVLCCFMGRCSMNDYLDHQTERARIEYLKEAEVPSVGVPE